MKRFESNKNTNMDSAFWERMKYSSCHLISPEYMYVVTYPFVGNL